jgi:hypothetical protein
MVRIREDILMPLLLNAVNETATKPDFKADPNIWEGKASKEELKYRQDLLDQLNLLYKATGKVSKSDISVDDKHRKIDLLVTDYISKAQEIAKNHLNNVYNNKFEEANQKIEDIGLKPVETEEPSDILTKLVAYQMFAIEKAANKLRYELFDKLYREEYFSENYYVNQ